MAATTITRATITDDSGSGTDGSVLNSAFFGTSIYDKVDGLFTGANFILESSHSGTDKALVVYNTSNTASSGAYVSVQVAGSSAADPRVILNIPAATGWCIGVDNSDGDKLKIVDALQVGSGDTLTLDTVNNVVLGTAAIATNATDGFLYIPSCAGAASGTPTTYTGRCPIVFDTTNNRLYIWNGSTWRYASTT